MAIFKKCAVKTLMSIFLAIALTAPYGILGAAFTDDPSSYASARFQVNDGGVWRDSNLISMTEPRDYLLTFDTKKPVSGEEDLNISIARDKGEQNSDPSKGQYWPNQFLGGALSEWKRHTSTPTEIFAVEDVNVAIADNFEDGVSFEQVYIRLSAKTLFNSNRIDSPRGNRNAVLDYTGDYNIVVSDKKGEELARTTVRYAPYESFRSMDQIYDEIDLITRYINDAGNLYAEKRVMGKSADGREMPYIILAKDQSSVEQYKRFRDAALKDPEKALSDVEMTGAKGYKVPILFSNIHPDEFNGADSVLNVAWDIAKSAENDWKTPYRSITGFNDAGKERLEFEKNSKKVVWSSLLQDEEGYWPTGVGFVNGSDSSTNSLAIDLDKYYDVEDAEIDVAEMLENVFFILVPTENVDGRTYSVRQNG
ncbi:MAG: hypothetical protein LBL35_02155, partial [Clostridiales bacterium]|nr:hypothetical protein [Clostridiales bacterium]